MDTAIQRRSRKTSDGKTDLQRGHGKRGSGNEARNFTEAFENVERNGQQTKEDNEKNRIAQEAELMAEIAALQIATAGLGQRR